MFSSETATPGNQSSTGSILPGVWQHVTVTYDKVKVTFYINGKQDTQLGMTGGLKSSTNQISIGKDGSYAQYPYNGLIDDVRIYNRALSAAEIAELYNAGAQGKIKSQK